MRAELQELGGNRLAYLPAFSVEDVEFCDVVNVPLDPDLLPDVLAVIFSALFFLHRKF